MDKSIKQKDTFKQGFCSVKCIINTSDNSIQELELHIRLVPINKNGP